MLRTIELRPFSVNEWNEQLIWLSSIPQYGSVWLHWQSTLTTSALVWLFLLHALVKKKKTQMFNSQINRASVVWRFCRECYNRMWMLSLIPLSLKFVYIIHFCHKNTNLFNRYRVSMWFIHVRRWMWLCEQLQWTWGSWATRRRIRWWLSKDSNMKSFEILLKNNRFHPNSDVFYLCDKSKQLWSNTEPIFSWQDVSLSPSNPWDI